MFKLTRRALGVFILSFGVVVPTAVLAQTEQQASPDKGVEGTGHKYGEWSIYNPPPISQPPPGVTSPVLPFRHPNPDAYRENQQRMLKERREQIEKGNVPVPPPPGSIAPLDPPVTVLSPNIDGLQRSDPNVNGNPGNSNKPDTQVAVGPNHVLEVVNFGVQVFGKSGGNIIAKTDLWTFFGQDPTNVYLGDPRVRFAEPVNKSETAGSRV